MNALPELVARVTLWFMDYRPIRQWRMNRLRRKRLKELGIPEESEPMFKGKLTYSGIAVATVSVVLGWLGVGDETSAAQIVQHGGELIGLAMALYGRYRAAK